MINLVGGTNVTNIFSINLTSTKLRNNTYFGIDEVLCRRTCRKKNPWHGKYHIVLFGQNHVYMQCNRIAQSRHFIQDYGKVMTTL